MDILDRRIIISGLAVFSVILLTGSAILMPDGEALFHEQRCYTCHRLKGQGGLAGPDLTGVIGKRGVMWTMRQIRNPQSHNPASRMPSYDHLGYIETYAIISYLKG